MRHCQKSLPGLYLLCTTAFFLLSGCPANNNADKTFPSRPITMIVPWAAGGMTDMSARLISTVLQQNLGSSVNVVNRTGGGGVVGHLAISQARADGHTLGAVTVEITQLHHMGLTDLSYKNYTPLALLIHNPAGITVRADAPWENIQDLLTAIQENPGDLKASGTARGGIWDLARIGFLEAAGLTDRDLPWVPSQGSSPALQELLAGGVDVVTASLSEVDALRKAGQVKTLGVMADERIEMFPEVPTLKEMGIEWSLGGWVSICAPAGIPEDVKETLIKAIEESAADAQFIDALEKAGSSLRFMTGQALSDFIKQQDITNGQLMENAGLTR